MGSKHGPAIERFWTKVAKGPDCWEWQGAQYKGYGQLRLSHPSRAVLAHRFSWAIHFGPIPVGLEVCHRCDNPACVRPDHLFLGTHAENMADAARKGRAAGPVRPGASNHQAKLTEAEVSQIRWRRSNGEELKALAFAFAVSVTTIKAIVYRKSWSDVA